jgi:hypothetical protein
MPSNKYKSEYWIWVQMKQRCYNPKATRYEFYGGKGITVCKRWIESFDAFILDMGQRPSKRHSIERRDNNGNYEPNNCYWATYEEQRKNQKNWKLSSAQADIIRGIYKLGKCTQTDLAKIFGVTQAQISNIVRKKS